MFDDLDDLLLDRVNEALREWVPGLEVFVGLHALACLAAAAAARRLSTMQHTHAQVVAVRTTKPRIPSIILVNYEKQESTRAKLLVLQQQQVLAQNHTREVVVVAHLRASLAVHAIQKNTLKKAETERRTAVMEAQKQLEVSIIDSSRQVEQAASRLEISEIDAQMHVDRAREHANAMFCTIAASHVPCRMMVTITMLCGCRAALALSADRLTKQAEVMQSVLTPQFLRLQEMKNTWRNTKVCVLSYFVVWLAQWRVGSCSLKGWVAT